jgi:hypothetical protein
VQTLLFLANNSGETIKFYEDYNHPKPDARKKWHVFICNDFEDMKDKEVCNEPK